MQNAAQKQAEIYDHFNCGVSEGEEYETEIVKGETSVSIEEEEQKSSRMNRFFRKVNRIYEEQPCAFSNEDSEDIIFYSQNINSLWALWGPHALFDFLIYLLIISEFAYNHQWANFRIEIA